MPKYDPAERAGLAPDRLVLGGRSMTRTADLMRPGIRLNGCSNARFPAPVRRFLPKLIDLVWNHRINPGKVFDLELPLAKVAEGYRAMDERRAIKALLWPS